MKFKILESIDKGIIKHLDHLEDYVVLYGQAGIKKLINDVSNIIMTLERDEDINISEKIDGAPALYFGIDGRTRTPFVATKSIDNVSPKMNHSVEEIKMNHESPGLQEKLIYGLNYLSKLPLDQNIVFHSDVLFTENDKKQASIAGKNYIIYKPNTIVYAAEEGTDVNIAVAQAKFGLVVHTVYEADYSGERNKLSQTSKSHIDNLLNNDNPELFIISGDMPDVKFDADVEDLEFVENSLNEIMSYNISNILEENKDIKNFLLMFINKQTEGGGIFDREMSVEEFVSQFYDYLQTRYGKQIQGKGERGQQNAINKFNQIYEIITSDEFLDIIEVLIKSIEIKKILLKYFAGMGSKLGDTFFYNQDKDEYIGTAPEGFVLVDEQGVTKMVDRAEFSKRNRLYTNF